MDELKLNSEEIIEACRLLEIEDSHSLRDVKRSFRRLAARLHPDVCIEGPAVRAERFQALKRAYDVLVEYCETYPVRFYMNEKRNDPEYDHIMRFYNGWLGDIPKKRLAILY